MKYFFLFLMLCVSILFTPSCQNSITEKLQEVEQLIKIAPDSALHILQNLENNYTQMNDEGKAMFGLLLFNALDQNALKSFPPEKIDFSIHYYTFNKEKKHLAYCYFYKARMYKNERDYKNVIQNLLKSKELVSPEKDHDLLARIYFELAQISGFQGEFDKAEEYYKLADSEFGKAGDRERQAKTYITMGWLYLAKEDFDLSIEYSRKALDNTPDSIIMGDALNNIGNSYYYKEQFDSALYYLRKSLSYTYFDTNISSRYYHLANVYSYTRQFDSAYVYVNQALQYPIDIYFEEECYRILTKIAFEKDNIKDLKIYVNKQQICQDSIKKLEQQTNINVLEKMHQTDIETASMKNQLLLLTIAIICLFVAGGTIFLILHKRNKQKQIKAEIYKKEHAKVQQEYRSTKKEADIYKSELKRNKELLVLDLKNELDKTKTKYADMRKSANAEQREALDKKIFDEVLHVDDEKAFIFKMNKVLNNLPEKLKQDFPDLNYKEVMWCCLFSLDFSTPEISLIMGFKQSTQYKFKQRLSKKLNLAGPKELEQMLSEKINI